MNRTAVAALLVIALAGAACTSAPPAATTPAAAASAASSGPSFPVPITPLATEPPATTETLSPPSTGAETPTPLVSAPAETTPPAATPSGTPASTATATAASPSPTATPAPLAVKWTRDPGNAGLGGLEHAPLGAAVVGSLFVMAGQRTDADGGDHATIWSSPDAKRWTAVDLGGVLTRVYDVAAGGPGAVAVGEEGGAGTRPAVWLSADGRSWTRVPDQPSLGSGDMGRVIALPAGGLVAFGGQFPGESLAWTSPDGSAWTSVTNTSALHVAGSLHALYRLGEYVYAFADAASGKLELWRTKDGAAWTKVATLPEKQSGAAMYVTHGARGWVAIGDVMDANPPAAAAWRSDDGIQWQRVASPPFQDASVNSVLAVPTGFVAVGTRGEKPGVTCGTGEPLQAWTWTSSDGATWTELPKVAEFAKVSLDRLFRDHLTLVALGGTFAENGDVTRHTWSAQLPPAASNGSASKPHGPFDGQGCGP